jgi:hypothetical protein
MTADQPLGGAMKERLHEVLGRILAKPDPREELSTYHDMPYAIFRYHPKEEFETRRQTSLLATLLGHKGKRVHRISLAECLKEALEAQERPLEDWYQAEIDNGLETLIETIHSVLATENTLVDLVLKRMPTNADPQQDIVFIQRTGALYPVYRTFSLLEQMQGQVMVPTILFYPGTLEGPAGLRFMGVLEAEHNYRPKIF